MRIASAPLRAVKESHLRAGATSVFVAFKTHWWELDLECGHTVERSIRWKKIPNPPRGYAAQHNPPGLDRLPDPPKSARCEMCSRERF